MSDRENHEARSGETIVRYRYSAEAGTSCRHCGATYAKCTEDVLREFRDPEANEGCCDECRDASGHQVRAVLSPHPRAVQKRLSDFASKEQTSE